jgi:hypothetical protein
MRRRAPRSPAFDTTILSGSRDNPRTNVGLRLELRRMDGRVTSALRTTAAAAAARLRLGYENV